MSTTPAEAPAASKHDVGDKLRHIYCIAHGIPATGLCGAPRNKDLTHVKPLIHETSTPPNRCIVCEDLKMLPCNICGK